MQLAYSLLIPGACLLAIRKYATSQYSILLTRNPLSNFTRIEYSALIGLVTILWMSSIVVHSILFQVWGTNGEGQFSLTSPLESKSITLVYFAFLAVLAGFFEEFFYRGVLGETLAPKGAGVIRQFVFIAISSSLFGLEHRSAGLPQMGTSMYVGLIASFVYLKTRTIWPLVAAHILTDLVLVVWTFNL